MDEIKLFSPATVANISCGFDVLGLCLEGIGDQMTFRKTTKKGLSFKTLSGFTIPKELNNNVAGVAARTIYNAAKPKFGIEIDIVKNIKPGSGIGSSAASASGAVFGINKLLENRFSKKELIAFAMKGEAIASGSEHADNIAPGIMGNITLITDYSPLNIVVVPPPRSLYVSILHPQIEIKTAVSRAILPEKISLKTASNQCGKLGGLIAGCYTEDYNLIGQSLTDYIAEPFRKDLIPNYQDVKRAALKAKALGCGISGAGPSIFALSKGVENASAVAEAMNACYHNSPIEVKLYTSKINTKGIHLIS
jgi:homoserine kinase